MHYFAATEAKITNSVREDIQHPAISNEKSILSSTNWRNAAASFEMKLKLIFAEVKWH